MKRLIALMMLFVLLVSFSACNAPEYEEKAEGDTESTQTQDTVNDKSEAVSSYKPGVWTANSYTSKWLNLKFEKTGAFMTTEENIEITKKYNEARIKDNPNNSITEMEFYSQDYFSNSKGKEYISIALYVEPITQENKTLEEYANEVLQETIAAIQEYNTAYTLLESENQYVKFLGKRYLLHHNKIRTTRIYETYSLYRIKDGYLIQIQICAPENLMNLSYILTSFSTLNKANGDTAFIEIQDTINDKNEVVSSPDNSQGGDNAKKYCSQCGKSEPDTVFYEDWKTGDNCAACGYNNFNGGEDAKKYCSQCGADCTYRGLEADGRCEDCVSKDNIPTGCSHDYTEATCSKPKTCTKCGETTGSALGHDYTAATCIAPMTCETCGDTAGTVNPSAHTYQPIYSQAHYDEVGHYENVEVSYKKTVYLCFFCGYNQKGYDSLDDLREHISVHSNSYNYDAIVSRPDLLADTREVWATRYEQQWVVDEEAHDEMVVTGYTCTLCDSRKAP